jgi:hypothetical protein
MVWRQSGLNHIIPEKAYFWLAAASGEENRDLFIEAHILDAGFFVGKMMTGEIGTGWRRGRLE